MNNVCRRRRGLARDGKRVMLVRRFREETSRTRGLHDMRTCGIAARYLNAPPVIRANQRNLRTYYKSQYNGPLITQITLIVDARNLRTARACGVSARYLNGPDVICVISGPIEHASNHAHIPQESAPLYQRTILHC
jgi:hypothetical protein